MHPKSEEPTKPDAPKVIPSTPPKKVQPEDSPAPPPKTDELPSLPPR
jgi:hypothetical protein